MTRQSQSTVLGIRIARSSAAARAPGPRMRSIFRDATWKSAAPAPPWPSASSGRRIVPIARTSTRPASQPARNPRPTSQLARATLCHPRSFRVEETNVEDPGFRGAHGAARSRRRSVPTTFDPPAASPAPENRTLPPLRGHVPWRRPEVQRGERCRQLSGSSPALARTDSPSSPFQASRRNQASCRRRSSGVLRSISPRGMAWAL